jgi:phosphoglycerate kinase
VIDSLLKSADRLLIGGGMCYTFLAAQGYEIGTSILDSDRLEVVKGYIETAKKLGVEIVLPTDLVVAEGFSSDARSAVVDIGRIPPDMEGMDIGPVTRETFAAKLADARTVFWNGPVGVFEMAKFAEGTRAVAHAVVAATSNGALTVIGGGDSAAAVRQLGFTDDQFSHISTGGGASLEYLEGKSLPGLEVLEG